MLSTIGRARTAMITAVVLMMAAAMLVVLARPAHADYVVCPPGGRVCYVVVTRPGTPGDPGGGGGGGGGGSTKTMCQYKDEIAVPCYDPERGWYNEQNGCYFKVDTEVNELLGRPGNYEVRCGPGRVGGCNCYTYIGSLFFPDPPPGFGGPPSPAQLAAQAINRLPLRAPAIGMAPSEAGAGLVGLPVWMWTAVTAETWGPISATAAIPGLSVTATANATKIVWNMGDGNTVTCTSPGTPYDRSYGNAESPTCGYRYSVPSPGRYTVTATTTWHITWAGGGESGALDTTGVPSVAAIEIDELQVVTS